MIRYKYYFNTNDVEKINQCILFIQLSTEVRQELIQVIMSLTTKLYTK